MHGAMGLGVTEEHPEPRWFSCRSCNNVTEQIGKYGLIRLPKYVISLDSG